MSLADMELGTVVSGGTTTSQSFFRNTPQKGDNTEHQAIPKDQHDFILPPSGFDIGTKFVIGLLRVNK